MSEQLHVEFTPNPLAGQPRPRKVRKGATERYEQALAYLRLKLKANEYVEVHSSEFSDTFKLTRAFLVTLSRMGAVDRVTTTGRQYAYKTKPLLDKISASDVIEECRLAGNKEEEPVIDNEAKCGEEWNGEAAAMWPSAIYMIGIIKQDSPQLVASLHGPRPVDPEMALNFMRELTCEQGDKLVLLQVVEVLESTRVLQPSSL